MSRSEYFTTRCFHWNQVRNTLSMCFQRKNILNKHSFLNLYPSCSCDLPPPGTILTVLLSDRETQYHRQTTPARDGMKRTLRWPTTWHWSHTGGLGAASSCHYCHRTAAQSTSRMTGAHPHSFTKTTAAQSTSRMNRGIPPQLHQDSSTKGRSSTDSVKEW